MLKTFPVKRSFLSYFIEIKFSKTVCIDNVYETFLNQFLGLVFDYLKKNKVTEKHLAIFIGTIYQHSEGQYLLQSHNRLM